MTSLTFYGGAGEIGGNKILLRDGDTRLFFDFGTPFHERYNYFEEYLKPRSGAGLLDILEMGLLPRLKGIYRQDLDPGGRFTARYGCQEMTLNGVLVSHAHVDHTGYISFLRPDIPIYATAMTAFIARAMQDAGQSDFEKEVCYLSPRHDNGEGYLETDRRASYQGRPFVFMGGSPGGEEAAEFWSRSPGSRKGLEVAASTPTPDKIGSLPLRHFPVDHSVFGASAYAVQTSSGWVVYTGDIRRHGRNAAHTEAFIREAARPRPVALLCEGTRAERDEPGVNITEEEVAENVRSRLREARGLVVADFGPRNVERLLIFLEAARETGRRLAILSKDAYLLDAMHLADPTMPCPMETPDILVYRDLKDSPRAWEKGVLDRYAHRLVAAADVGARPQDFVLCFSFWDIKNLIDIQPKGGTYIYSSSEAYNEEQEMDLTRLRNWLEHFHIQTVGLPHDDGHGKWVLAESDQGLHSSGHASVPDLVQMVKDIAPRTVIPIHTENPGMFRERLAGTGIQVRVPNIGEAIQL